MAAVSGLLFGVIEPLFQRYPFAAFRYLGRPYLRAGVRALGVLLGGWIGRDAGALALAIWPLITYPLVVQLNRVARELIRGGVTGLRSWWASSWRSIVNAEVIPLPAAWLGADVYTRLGTLPFLLACALLLGASVTVRRATLSLQRQSRSLSELTLLNQVSRAIIRSGMDVDALCELVYAEASKLVDTSSFHLGLFDRLSPRYTLLVRVQDRVRQPPLTVDIPHGDGIIGWMRQTGRSLLVDDFVTEMAKLPARPRYQSDNPPRSGIYVPLIADDLVIGSISIQSYRPSAFGAADLRLLSLVADQTAVAISRARSYADTRRRAVQLEAIHEVGRRINAILEMDELLPSIVNLIRERFGYHPVHIFLLEDDGQLHFRASTTSAPARRRLQQLDLRLGVGLVGRAAVDGYPLMVNDVSQEPNYIADDPETRAELVVPLRFGERTLGALDVQSTTVGRFSDEDLFVMQTLAGQIATAIESARAFSAQREEAWVLNALLQVAENMDRSGDLLELLPVIVRLPPLLIGCDRCVCILKDGATLTPLAGYGIPAEQRGPMQVPLSAAAAQLLQPALLRFSPTTLAASELEGALRQIAGEGVLLALPLSARGAPVGVLALGYDHPAAVPRNRVLTLAVGIATQLAIALEGALLAREAAEAQRLDQELRVAREIQTTLLPAAPPTAPGWELAADWRSARLVGGDFYDFWTLKPGDSEAAPTIGFVIADVSDKGVPAALFMTLARSLLRTAALDGASPAVALERANRWLTRDSYSGMFVTLFYGQVQPENGTLRYCCAGHNPPLLLRAGGVVEELATGDIALGVLEGPQMHERETVIRPGDLLVAYTDGITEAIAADDEPFGVERLIGTAQASRALPAAQIVSAITDALAAFVGDRQPFDDVTLVVIKREAV